MVHIKIKECDYVHVTLKISVELSFYFYINSSQNHKVDS